MKEYKFNQKVKSKKTGKEGVIQATYPDGLYSVFTGNHYEHLKTEEIEEVVEVEVKEHP